MAGLETTASTPTQQLTWYPYNITFGPFWQRRRLEPSTVRQLYRPGVYYQSLGMACLEGEFFLAAVRVLHLLWCDFLRDRLQGPAHSFLESFSVESRRQHSWTLERFSLASFFLWSSSFRIASQPSGRDQVHFPSGTLRCSLSSECLL